MIADEREYAATLGRRRELLEIRAMYLAHPQEDPLAQEWLVASVDSVIARADEEIAEYEALRGGEVREVVITALGELPAALVKARIAAGLTQRELAERLGVAERVVQRDEAGGYGQATLDRLQRVAEALGLRVAGSLRFPARPDSVSTGG